MLTVSLHDKYHPDIYIYDKDKLIYEKKELQSKILIKILRETIGSPEYANVKREAYRTTIKKAYIKKEHFRFFIELLENMKQGGWNGKNTASIKINALRREFNDIIIKQQQV